MKPGDMVRAVFVPPRRDDLREGMCNFIMQRGLFAAGWIVEDGEPYAGQWAMIAPDWWPCSWVPLCDLAEVETVRSTHRLSGSHVQEDAT